MTKKRITKTIHTWDTIAESFDKTRKKPWSQCIEYIQKQEKKETIIDLACGNGRHLLPASEIYNHVIGIDISEKLLQIIQNKKQQKNIQLIQADIVEIPLKNNIADVVLFIAALHNIEGKNNRIQALKEIKRILKKDGQALISVWSSEQEKFKKDIDSNGNINIYWKQDKLNIPRFYHLYSREEFIDDLKKTGLKIIDFKEEKIRTKDKPDNYFAIVTV